MDAKQIDDYWDKMTEGQGTTVARALVDTAELSPAARTLRGMARYEAGNYADSEADFTAVLELLPDSVVARLHRGLARFRLGNTTGALEDLKSGAFFPEAGFLKRFLRTFWPLRFTTPELARIEAPEPAPDTVLLNKEYQAWKAAPDSMKPGKRAALAERMSERGVKQFFGKHFGMALELFRRAGEMEPENEIYQNYISSVKLHLGQSKEALAIIEPLVRNRMDKYLETNQPDDLPTSDLLAHWAFCLHECGQHRAALAVIARVRPEGPEDFNIHLIAALCWMMLDERLKSEAAFDLALGDFFYDSWGMVIEPFTEVVMKWLSEQPVPSS